MKRLAFLAAATLLAAPVAFAQSAVTSSTGSSVSSGTGVVVTPGAPSASTSTAVTVAPATSVKPAPHLLPGGAMVQHGSTTVLGGPSGNVAGTKTEITTYWVNVPADAPRDASFRRWQSLK